MIAGSPSYIAPEVWRCETFDHRIDVYSLAAVAFRCLAGRAPFAAPNPLELYMKAIKDERPRLTDFRPDLPRRRRLGGPRPRDRHGPPLRLREHDVERSAPHRHERDDAQRREGAGDVPLARLIRVSCRCQCRQGSRCRSRCRPRCRSSRRPCRSAPCVPLMQTPLMQSLGTRQVSPAEHRSAQSGPPQSLAVSVPFLALSLHAAVMHLY